MRNTLIFLIISTTIVLGFFLSSLVILVAYMNLFMLYEQLDAQQDKLKGNQKHIEYVLPVDDDPYEGPIVVTWKYR